MGWDGYVGGGKPGDGEEAATPAAHLAALLGRAANAFEIDGSTVLRLTGALMHHTELHSICQRNVPPTLRCSTYKHVFLLSDGSSPALWELRHNTAEDARPHHEIHPDRESLLRAERRVAERMGLGRHFGSRQPTDEVPGAVMLTVSLPSGRRAFPEGGSAEHARRLLRRARNADRPGDDVLRRLREQAHGHRITRIPKPCGTHRHHRVWCSVYEHAFLLRGGNEISLYELEHNLTPDGLLVCEVYLDEATADQAADRYARACGVDL